MKLFNIYITKSKSGIIEDLVAVRNGGSFWAFLFNILWFIQHKMWKESTAWLLINFIFNIFFQKGWFGYFDIIILELGLALIIGTNAHYWYGRHLMRNNYQFFGCVFAGNKEEAKLMFIRNCFDSKSSNIPLEDIFSPSILDVNKNSNGVKYFTV